MAPKPSPPPAQPVSLGVILEEEKDIEENRFDAKIKSVSRMMRNTKAQDSPSKFSAIDNTPSSRRGGKRGSVLVEQGKGLFERNSDLTPNQTMFKRMATTDFKRRQGAETSMKKESYANSSLSAFGDNRTSRQETETFIEPKDEHLKYLYVVFSPDLEILERVNSILKAVPEVQKNIAEHAQEQSRY
mmetsp:Transcript_10735/g.16331  ORF Transcript_10735/g.16331 Transcript_10735/m.16331 type:complete len:187 (-) Transcript_10735:236-796(-)